MKIIIMGPILSSDLSTLINEKDLKKIPVGQIMTKYLFTKIKK